jgi:isopentenyl diphosphate isomerase/L-lactate dehydrogenase-like FMN-dependent dehydrogenase
MNMLKKELEMAMVLTKCYEIKDITEKNVIHTVKPVMQARL